MVLVTVADPVKSKTNLKIKNTPADASNIPLMIETIVALRFS